MTLRSETRIVAASSVENCELCVIFVPQFPICMSCIIPRLFRSNSITNAAKHCTVVIFTNLNYSNFAYRTRAISERVYYCFEACFSKAFYSRARSIQERAVMLFFSRPFKKTKLTLFFVIFNMYAKLL